MGVVRPHHYNHLFLVVLLSGAFLVLHGCLTGEGQLLAAYATPLHATQERRNAPELSKVAIATPRQRPPQVCGLLSPHAHCPHGLQRTGLPKRSGTPYSHLPITPLVSRFCCFCRYETCDATSRCNVGSRMYRWHVSFDQYTRHASFDGSWVDGSWVFGIPGMPHSMEAGCLVYQA